MLIRDLYGAFIHSFKSVKHSIFRDMKLLISKEKFAGILGYENFEDFKKTVGKEGKRAFTAAKIDKAYELIRKHSRYLI